MQVNFYVNRETIFNGKILNEQNKQNIQKLREKLNDNDEYHKVIISPQNNVS